VVDDTNPVDPINSTDNKEIDKLIKDNNNSLLTNELGKSLIGEGITDGPGEAYMYNPSAIFRGGRNIPGPIGKTMRIKEEYDRLIGPDWKTRKNLDTYDAQKKHENIQRGDIWGKRGMWGDLFWSLPWFEKTLPDYDEVPIITGQTEEGEDILKSGKAYSSKSAKNTRLMKEKFKEEYDKKIEEAERRESLKEGLLAFADQFRNVGKGNEPYMYQSPFSEDV
jgi:hypothetical protein